MGTNGYIAINNISLGIGGIQPMSPYAGPVPGLQWQFISSAGTSDLNLATATPNTFIKGNSGNDAISVYSGNNVLDGGTGSNFLVGGTGSDTFFVDARAAAVTWSTFVHFHSGDSGTLWGWQPGVSRISWSDNQGAAGYLGATAHFDIQGNGQITASMTFAGLSVAQVQHYSITAGTVQGNSYWHIAA